MGTQDCAAVAAAHESSNATASDAHRAKKRRLLPAAAKPFTWTPGFDIRQPEIKKAWEQDGYIVVKGLLQADELQRLQSALTTDANKIEKYAYGRDDGMGRNTRLCLWNHPGKDVTGMIARVPKVAGLMGELLGGEVYHYHTKLMMKDARTGGAHLWHQDFGYWCQNGNLFPDMATVFIPLDKMDAENAGLQVIRGSHKLGLLQHVQTGAQAEADPRRREWALQAGMEHVQLEMEPGDALFFHCLTLHTSGQNHSDRRRWCFLVAFNRADNDPLIAHHHPSYTPLEAADDDAIRNPSTPLLDFDGKDFMNPSDDKSVKKYKEHGFH